MNTELETAVVTVAGEFWARHVATVGLGVTCIAIRQLGDEEARRIEVGVVGTAVEVVLERWLERDKNGDLRRMARNGLPYAERVVDQFTGSVWLVVDETCRRLEAMESEM